MPQVRQEILPAQLTPPAAPHVSGAGGLRLLLRRIKPKHGFHPARASPGVLSERDLDVCPSLPRPQRPLYPQNTHPSGEPRASQCLLWGRPRSHAPRVPCPPPQPTSHTPPPNREGLSRGLPAVWGGPSSLLTTPLLTEVAHNPVTIPVREERFVLGKESVVIWLHRHHGDHS